MMEDEYTEEYQNETIPVIIKLITGEEIFALLDGYGDERVIIKKAYKIHRIMYKKSFGIESNLLFEPWLDYAVDHTISITTNNIIVCEPLKPELYPLYIKMIKEGTNIQIEDNDDPEELLHSNKTKPSNKKILH